MQDTQQNTRREAMYRMWTERGGRVRLEPTQRRIRVVLSGTTVGDTRRAQLLYLPPPHNSYAFPREDLRWDLIHQSGGTDSVSGLGEIKLWTVEAGGKTAENAAWTVPQPPADLDALAGLVMFRWNLMDAWYEEDDEVFVHPRDPGHRVDVLNSSRHVKVMVDGELVAETRAAPDPLVSGPKALAHPRFTGAGSELTGGASVARPIQRCAAGNRSGSAPVHGLSGPAASVRHFAAADPRRPGGWLTQRAGSRATARAALGSRKPLTVRPHPHPDRGVLPVIPADPEGRTDRRIHSNTGRFVPYVGCEPRSSRFDSCQAHHSCRSLESSRLKTAGADRYTILVSARNTGTRSECGSGTGLVEQAGGRYWVAVFGETNTVKNARAAGRVTLRRGAVREDVLLGEVPVSERVPYLRARIGLSSSRMLRPYFGATPQSSDAEFAEIAPEHTVFKLEPV